MKSLRNLLPITFAVIVLLAYLLPEWAAYLRSEIFVFVNGWDEETYLSWQGVLGSRNELGYFVLHLYGLLHEQGMSGAMQNLLSDTFFPLLTVGLVTGAFEILGFERGLAFSYAVLVLFSSTLFNYANPVIKYLLGSYDGTSFLMAGWELYPSILRTPNPQTSYFLVALAVYAWLRWRRFWILLLPLPLLYYFVAVPYVFLLSMAVGIPVMRRVPNLPEWTVVTVSASIVYVFMALGAFGLFLYVGYYNPENWVVHNAWIYARSRMPQLPLALLIGVAILLIVWRMGLLDPAKNKGNVLQILIFAALASVNLHIVTGFMLSQKNYYDYGLSILFGMMLVVMLEWFGNQKLKEAALIALLLIISIPTLLSHLYFYHRAVAIGAKMAPYIDEARQDPLHALIPDLETSSRVAYSTPKLVGPPFSYQYYFPFIEKQCSYYPELLAAGLAFARQSLAGHEAMLRQLEGTVANIRRGQSESHAIPYKNASYCDPASFRSSGFKLFGVAP